MASNFPLKESCQSCHAQFPRESKPSSVQIKDTQISIINACLADIKMCFFFIHFSPPSFTLTKIVCSLYPWNTSKNHSKTDPREHRIRFTNHNKSCRIKNYTKVKISTYIMTGEIHHFGSTNIKIPNSTFYELFFIRSWVDFDGTPSFNERFMIPSITSSK